MAATRKTPKQAAGSYIFPSIHDFPPFYTIQPTISTRTKQLQLWCEILLQYCAATRTSELLVAPAAMNQDPMTQAVFANERIRRRLNREAIQQIVDELVQQGQAEWDSPAKDQCLIYWRKPEDWGAQVYKWAFDSGSTGSICTVYELLHGEYTEGQEFHGLNEKTMVKALEALAKLGKAQLFVGSTDLEMGVKFS
ncbi:ESCRT-II complex subunit-domain-containing protein [Fimicolochytrium jonesii]|uniref:ESCRT-II complex subunit-domain-containing protein n=1 Tax=Fimicolochytrium jonesii TaxID=1396493 RepID=UPI0022FE3BA1|nr:ESCRT-II complex subunit-domain-containing protein [Fimicolochytrium jonesii]KAI8819178.1 ESCRT-II complex subunit-domain-containing protein [Fimicolochytrium jonesii]